MPDRGGGLVRRLGWFFLLYFLGVGSVGVVAFGLRVWLRHA